MGTTHHRIRLGLIGLLACAVGIPLSSAPPRAGAEPVVTITWTTEERTLDDGRTYFVRAPTCEPDDAAECSSYLGRARPLVVWFHHANGAEDPSTARNWLATLHFWSRNTIFAFAVSEGGTKMWDAGICCTSTTVDDVGYLSRVVDDVAARWAVARTRVGAAGFSNGGMLAQRAACERPELVAAATSLAGSYAGPCTAGTSRVGQWHGADDRVAPLNGGNVLVNGVRLTVPPAASLAQRMAAGSLFELYVRPGRGHSLPVADFKASILWLVAHLPA